MVYVDSRSPRQMERIMSYNTILTETGCLEWAGTIQPIKNNRGGYGVANIPRHLSPTGRVVKTTAHRAMFFYVTGKLPPIVRHTCDNRKCIYPGHLLAGTAKDNTRDMLSRGRGRWQNHED